METDQEKFFPSKWLGAGNIPEPVDVTIAKVYSESVKGQQKGEEEEKTVPVIEFDELTKPLILNKTNFKEIVKISGEDQMEKWPGTRINLFTMKVDAFGEIRDAIRVQAPQGKEGA